MMEKKLYTLLVYSENVAGILSQITAVFTRRQLNIESLNVSASGVQGLHKYTITIWSDEEQIQKITKQIEKKIDVVKAYYFIEKELFINEIAIYKISTQKLMDNSEISHIIRKYDARMTEVNPTYTIVLSSGQTDEIIDLFKSLNEFDCILQYTRSGRIAVTRDTEEPINDFLNRQDK